ncbi:MAG: hypothetical protein ACRYGF_05725 [Janthinobacterium lividum]
MHPTDMVPSRRVTWCRLAETMFLLAAFGLFLLHFFHLRADFPNHSPWMDWAKYTDEGWYGDAAIRYYLRGTWHLPGDFNPGAALPVWPLLEALVFRFTGVGIVAARALVAVVFGGILLCGYVLLRGIAPVEGKSVPTRLFAAAGTAMLAASSFLYAFSRMAILEPLLVLWLLLALLVAHSIRGDRLTSRRVLRLITVGVLAALMVGTKTTAAFLLPAICYMLWNSSGWRLRVMLRDTTVAASAGVLPAAVYLFALRRAGLLADVRYLFTANAYTGITRDTFWSVVWKALSDGMWTGELLYPLVLLIAVAAMVRRSAWRDPVFVSLVLWISGYLAYIAYHANFQPRYYLVVAVPLILLLVRGSEHLVAWDGRLLYPLAPIFLFVLLWEGHSTLGYFRHPEYSFQLAAERIENIVESEPAHSHTVLSISGSNLSLMTGLPSICDDFGTMDLEDRIAVYKPGWFVTWNLVEDDKMEALTRFYRLKRVAAFPAMDDPDRNLMIVYRLDSRTGRKPERRKPLRPSPPREPDQISD